MQGTFCLGNPFDSSLNTTGISKLSGLFPLISYPETDFITIIAGLPGSWQLLPSKTLNSLADDCCCSVVLSAGGWGCRGERLHLQRLDITASPPSSVFHHPAVQSFHSCPSRVACGSPVTVCLQQPSFQQTAMI